MHVKSPGALQRLQEMCVKSVGALQGFNRAFKSLRGRQKVLHAQLRRCDEIKLMLAVVNTEVSATLPEVKTDLARRAATAVVQTKLQG